MDLAKLNPWYWFKHEDSADKSTNQFPVTREEAQQRITPQGADTLFRPHQEMEQLFDDVSNAFDMPSLRTPAHRSIWARQPAGMAGRHRRILPSQSATSFAISESHPPANEK